MQVSAREEAGTDSEEEEETEEDSAAARRKRGFAFDVEFDVSHSVANLMNWIGITT